jgi:hypothetical protein
VEPAGLRIDLSEAAAAKLDAIIRAGAAGIPEYGIEVGGILWGRTPAYDPSVLHIEELEMIPIEYQYGPVFQLSPRDRHAFAVMIQARDDDLRPLGIFRSHTRGRLDLTEDDLLLASVFGGSLGWILLIHASPVEHPMARLYWKEDSNGWREVPDFPLELVDRPVVPPRRSHRALPPPHRRSAAPVMAAVVLLWLVVASVFLGITNRPRSAIALGLHVQATGDALEVSWSPHPALIRKDARATLEVTDDSTLRRFSIDQQELRSGSLFYLARSRDVTFRFELVTQNSPPVVEILRLLNGGQPNVLPPAAPAIPEPELLQASEIEPETPEPGEMNGDSLAKPPPLLFRPPENGHYNKPPQSQILLPLPDIKDTAISPVGLAEELLPQAVAALPPPPPTAPVRYLAASPARKPTPAVPLNIRMLLREDVVVDIRVRIDGAGRVREAVPVGPENPSTRLLRSYCVQAALLWRFNPARMNGQPVPSEATVQFYFSRLGR